MVTNYEKNKDEKFRKELVNFYLNNLEGVNNWDLVDLSCYKILGDSINIGLFDESILFKFSLSENLWKRRISMISTLRLI